MKPKLYPIQSQTILELLLTNHLNLLEQAINASSNGIVITDAQQKDNPIIYVNEGFERITGYTFNEVVGRNCRFLQEGHHQQPGLKELRTALQEGKQCFTVLKNYRKDGSEFWNELYIAPVKDSQGRVTNFIGVQNDITKRKVAEEALKESETRFRSTFELAPIGMALVDFDGKFLQVNNALCETLGYDQAELMARSLLELSHPDDLAEEKLFYRRCLQGEITSFQLEKRYIRKDQSTIYVLVKVALVEDSNNRPLHYVVQILDLSCSLKQQTTELITPDQPPSRNKTLPDYFHYDGLTGLPSRVLFEGYIEQALKPVHKPCAIFFLDLDRFQVINESLGHSAGDQLLMAVSSRLESCLQGVT